MKLIEDTTERNLGKKRHKCRICGQEGFFQSYLVCEMMQNTRDEFEYFVCDNCNCLQIAVVPDDLEKYYGKNYYSFIVPEIKDSAFPDNPKSMIKILDVGCGNGDWLVQCAKDGYGNLYGCDPFIEGDIQYENRINIRKCVIHDIDGANIFDFIRFGDSYEHLSDPYETLLSAKRLLKNDGEILLAIPTYPNIAFDLFGPYWYQLDAPRHIFIHSMDSINYLAQKSGLKIKEVEYDSNSGQIFASFFYQHKISYYEITEELIKEYFPQQEISKICSMSKEANCNKYGDHMNVYLKKK